MRNHLISFILIILAVATYFAFTAPLWSQAEILKESIANDQDAIKEGRDLQALVQDVSGIVSEISPEQQSALEAILPEKVDEILLLNDIYTLAASHEMQVQDLGLVDDVSANTNANSAGASGDALSVSTASSGPKTRMVTFSVSAGYAPFVAFIKELEKSLGRYEIPSIKFSASTDGSTKAGSSASGSKSSQSAGTSYTVTITTYSVK